MAPVETDRHLVVIGGGMVAQRLIEALRSRDTTGSWRVTLLADELRRLANPDRAVFYTSGRTSNEAAFAYQLFVRQFGTNNLPDCSNMCHESTSVALAESIGIGKGSVSLRDIYDAELIVEFIEFIRGEVKFADKRYLVEQIGLDCRKALDILGKKVP